MKIFNRHALHKYQILEKVEAGVMLTGAEIKSIRANRISLTDAHAKIRDGEVHIYNMQISPWMGSQKFHDPGRTRKLLLHKNQILNWQGKIAGGNLTIVPLAVYIKRNLAKVELGLAKSKTKFDKRASLKKKTIQREIERELRDEKN